MRKLKISSRPTHRSSAMERYLNDISKFEMATAEEEISLARKIREGDVAALERLINANLRFVVAVAKQYQGQGLPLLDVINAGNIGLIEAAKRFDATGGFKFITYAVWLIRRRILEALADESRMIRLPGSQIDLLAKAAAAEQKLAQMLERQPTIEEVEELVGVPPRSQDGMRLFPSWGKHESLDVAASDQESGTPVDRLIDTSALDPDSNLQAESLRTDLRSALRILPEREREIITGLYGFDREPELASDIANRLELTEARVMQLYRKAKVSLREAAGARKILQEN